MIALHDGESDTVRYVQCGRRELSGGGGGLTPKKGIENHERKERGLAVIECSERWRDRCKRLMWTLRVSPSRAHLKPSV